MGCGGSKQKNNKVKPAEIMTDRENRRRAVSINLIDEILIYKPKAKVIDLKKYNSSHFVIAPRIGRLIEKNKSNKLLPR